MSLYRHLFYAESLQVLCSQEQVVQHMIHFEVALAQAQAQHGIITEGVAETIAKASESSTIDFEKLRQDIPLSGNAAAPLIKQLVRIVHESSHDAARYIHLGATSQDVVDTATVLMITQVIEWLEQHLLKLEKHLIKLTQEHRNTMMIGRTLMQQARPITFGLKTAGWLESINRSRQRLTASKNRLLCIQLGGAVGSQNSFLTKEVRKTMAILLELQDAPSYHSHRDNLAELCSMLGILTGSLGKMAKDVILMAQTEVGEVYEPAAEGRGTSSTMPHKRNPVLSTAIVANAHRVPHLVATMLSNMLQEHERAGGAWHAEWEVLTTIIGLTGGALEKAIELMAGLEVNTERMLQNLELTQGLIYAENVSLALAASMGKAQAHALVEEACKKSLAENRHLKTIILEMEIALSTTLLDRLFDPKNAIGLSLEIINEILSKYDNAL